MIYLLTPIVIQSEAKNLEGTHVDTLVYATEILPPFGRLNDIITISYTSPATHVPYGSYI